MTNWKKVLESNPMFNLIIRRTIDEHPGEDIEVTGEIYSSAKEVSLSITPGHDWLLGFTKRLFRDPKITWKYRLKRRTMTGCLFCEEVKFTIEASVLSKIYVNEWGKDKGKIIMETWQ